VLLTFLIPKKLVPKKFAPRKNLVPARKLFCGIFEGPNNLGTKLFGDKSGVHVLLVSLLVDQLSGLFLFFFWSTKTKLSSLTSVEGEQKNQRLTKKNSETDQNFFVGSLRLDNFFFGWPKKKRTRPDNWSTKRLTKSTWTPLSSCFFGKRLKYSLRLRPL
jgi:hypothetical protein